MDLRIYRTLSIKINHKKCALIQSAFLFITINKSYLAVAKRDATLAQSITFHIAAR